MGINSAAVAVFEVISVKKIDAVLTLAQLAQGGKGSKIFSCSAVQEANPDHSSMEKVAKKSGNP